MKTLFASALAVIILPGLAFAVHKAPAVMDIYKIDFTKIVIRGNARVELIQSNTQNVVTYEDASSSHTSITQKGDKLLINSDGVEPANIVVYVRNLQRIDAANTVVVSTRGKFSLAVLQVFLKDSAIAYVNAETESLYTVIKDRSDLKLKGSSADHTLAISKIAKLDIDQFTALKLTAATLDGRILAGNYRYSNALDTAFAGSRIRIK
ncbi:GIN domain-containing protein [Pedobacter africanus]|uniref:Adenosine/AMP kinase n=1 Tax=Pedobacter africanus TaxID=151894 RepID=A0ACC6KX86_9SPHI|nr:DUF2807 domain-containing protein [Pedobacter africanus]MDR6783728.1 adenosine/AMP kinase [Pedobacter africanus]